MDTATRRAGLVDARAVERVDAATTRAATSAKFAAVLISAQVVCTWGATSMGFFLGAGQSGGPRKHRLPTLTRAGVAMLRHAVRRAAATARALQAPAPAATSMAPARWAVPSVTRPAARRTFTGGSGGSVPSSTSEQARYLRDLNRNDPEAVVRLYEQGKVAASEGNLAEYLKVRP